MRDKHLDYLSKVEIFEAFSRKELTQLGRLAEQIEIAEGKDLTKEGTTGREFFVITKGQAGVYKKGRKVATLGPGKFFGELALIDGGPRNATVKADANMEVIVLGQREFLGLLHDVPTLAMKVMKGMASRLREADAKSIQ
jgi:CRP/FNR family cyclic AMP-dependent transcriptional regulator